MYYVIGTIWNDHHLNLTTLFIFLWIKNNQNGGEMSSGLCLTEDESKSTKNSFLWTTFMELLGGIRRCSVWWHPIRESGQWFRFMIELATMKGLLEPEVIRLGSRCCWCIREVWREWYSNKIYIMWTCIHHLITCYWDPWGISLAPDAMPNTSPGKSHFIRRHFNKHYLFYIKEVYVYNK